MIELTTSFKKTQAFVFEPTGEEMHLDWRLPTTAEIRAYTSDFYRAASEKETKDPDFPLSYGLAVLIGIRDNEWGIEGKPVSSNPDSPDYRSDWKEALAKNDLARIIITGLAAVAFGGARLKAEDEKKPVPFGTSSAN
jgi:hypothetical protein